MLKHIYDFFNKIKTKLSQKGQGMVEYALILAAVAVMAGVILADAGGLRTSITKAFTNAGDQIDKTSKPTGNLIPSGLNATEYVFVG